MPRLYRPHIPLSVRCEVAERQVISRFREGWLPVPAKPLGVRLQYLLDVLASQLKCETSDLRLDHDPPLAARPRRRRGLGKKTFYEPDANDPGHLFYRPHGPQFEGSHLIKTNVRGDHGQFPDRVLIKRERRRQKAKTGKPAVKYKWPSRPLRSRPRRGASVPEGPIIFWEPVNV